MFGGDPEELMRGLREFAAQQAETVAEAQREQFATLTLNTAVELTGAALKRIDVSGTSDEQALALRDAMRILFPEAVALVSAARVERHRGELRESAGIVRCPDDDHGVADGDRRRYDRPDRAARRAAIPPDCAGAAVDHGDTKVESLGSELLPRQRDAVADVREDVRGQVGEHGPPPFGAGRANP